MLTNHTAEVQETMEIIRRNPGMVDEVLATLLEQRVKEDWLLASLSPEERVRALVH